MNIMELSRNKKLLEYLNRILSGKYSDIEILNPFYLIYDVAVVEGDNRNIIKRFIYATPRLSDEFVVAVYSLGKGLYKAIRTFVRSLMSFKLKGTSLFFGSLNRDAEVVVLSWLGRRDLDAFIGQRNKDSIWKDIYVDFEKQGMRYQNIIIPLFQPSSAEYERLIADGNLILNVQMSHSWGWQFKLAAIGVYTFFSKFSEMRSIFDSIVYFSSHFSERYLFAVQMYHALRGMLKAVDKRYILLVPWEAHPEQKAIVKAFSESGSATFGYIHSALGNNWGYLSKIGSPLARHNYPDYLFVHGNDIVDMLARIGWNGDEIIKIRSIRYKRRSPEELKGKAFLPYSVDQVSAYLDIIHQLAKGGQLKVEDIVLHPDMRAKRWVLNKIKNIARGVDTENATVVAGMSTIIFEALEAGLTVKQLINGQYGVWHEDAYPSIRRRLVDSQYYELNMDEENRGATIDFSDSNTLVSDKVFVGRLNEMRRASVSPN